MTMFSIIVMIIEFRVQDFSQFLVHYVCFLFVRYRICMHRKGRAFSVEEFRSGWSGCQEVDFRILGAESQRALDGIREVTEEPWTLGAVSAVWFVNGSRLG